MLQRLMTKSDMGIHEQLGSQMGQYATMTAVARHTRHEFVFFERQLDRGFGVRALLDAFEIPNRVLPGRPIHAPGFVGRVPLLRRGVFLNFRPDESVALDPSIHQLSARRNWDLAGYFGLYEHWAPHLADLRRIFRFRPGRTVGAEEKVALARAAAGARRLVSLHVRRTDYLRSKVHVALSERYYREALAMFPRATHAVVVFSDDTAWCRAQPFLAERSPVFSDGNHPLVDMHMMALCDDNIIANSSFSVWGALLGGDAGRRVVCPKHFICPGSFPGWINGNYYPRHWTALDIE